MNYFQVTEHNDLPDLARFAPFKAVIVLEDSPGPLRRHQVAQWLVASGCLYAMVCGKGGESWERALRQANLEQVSIEEMEPRQFVMITLHRYDKLRGVFDYAKKHARHTHARLDDLLVVHVGDENRAIEYRGIYGDR